MCRAEEEMLPQAMFDRYRADQHAHKRGRRGAPRPPAELAALQGLSSSKFAAPIPASASPRHK